MNHIMETKTENKAIMKEESNKRKVQTNKNKNKKSNNKNLRCRQAGSKAESRFPIGKWTMIFPWGHILKISIWEKLNLQFWLIVKVINRIVRVCILVNGVYIQI